MFRALQRVFLCVAFGGSAVIVYAETPIVAADFYKLRSVGNVAFSPDATKIAYAISSNPTEGQPYSQLWIMDLASGRTMRVGDEQSRGSSPVWSPDGTRIAFEGRIGRGESGVVVVRAD